MDWIPHTGKCILAVHNISKKHAMCGVVVRELGVETQIQIVVFYSALKLAGFSPNLPHRVVVRRKCGETAYVCLQAARKDWRQNNTWCMCLVPGSQNYMSKCSL